MSGHWVRNAKALLRNNIFEREKKGVRLGREMLDRSWTGEISLTEWGTWKCHCPWVESCIGKQWLVLNHMTCFGLSLTGDGLQDYKVLTTTIALVCPWRQVPQRNTLSTCNRGRQWWHLQLGDVMHLSPSGCTVSSLWKIWLYLSLSATCNLPFSSFFF